MSVLVDVVNFNADASCLPTDVWRTDLSGGKNSKFFRWLSVYVTHGKKMVLGLTGSTVAELMEWNPESIDLINAHPGIFEIILRPFAHDVALLRTPAGFAANLEAGRRVLQKVFKSYQSYFLPPEFMLTNQQASWLADEGVKGVFINSNRFGPDLAPRIPTHPYSMKALNGRRIPCIPLDGSLTKSYLHALQLFDAGPWNRKLSGNKHVYSWRDGESPFLIPDGVEREAQWLKKESKSVKRSHFADLDLAFPEPRKGMLEVYPVHSFLSWMREFRMIGFLYRIQRVEDRLATMSPEAQMMWLMTIGSDILSSVEKSSPVVSISDRPKGRRRKTIIERSERWVEGEEYLMAAEMLLSGEGLPSGWADSEEPHIIRYFRRLEFLRSCVAPVTGKTRALASGAAAKK